jgi:hypothetical protein
MVLSASCGRENLEDAYSLIGEDEPDADLVGLILRLGNTHYFAGNPERASELNERGLGFAEALQLPEQLSRGWSTKATLVAPLRPEEARGLFELALDTALAHELYSQAAMVCGNLSDLHLRHDRYGESLDNLEQALKVAHRIGSRPSEWFALSEMTYALAMLGRWEEALARFAEIPDEQIGPRSARSAASSRSISSAGSSTKRGDCSAATRSSLTRVTHRRRAVICPPSQPCDSPRATIGLRSLPLNRPSPPGNTLVRRFRAQSSAFSTGWRLLAPSTTTRR